MIIQNEDCGRCLHITADEGHLDIVRFFVKELKSDVYVKDKSNYYPIHYAAQSENLRMFKFFVEELSCDPLCKMDSPPLSTLHVAAAAGNLASSTISH